jgi:6-phosphogluconate dehydrogenase
MKIAISGLGRMGSQIAKKLIKGNHIVIAHDRNHAPIENITGYGATPAFDKKALVDAFEGQPVILWIMIPAEAVDAEINDWVTYLPKGSIVIDGGNSDYRGDKARAEKLANAGITLIDVGTSGGIFGDSNGFSMMVGGDENAYNQIKPILDTLTAPHGGHQYFGEIGSGHYVKMIHNAIEYGIMESLAEGYRMLKEGPYNDIDLKKAGDVWQKSSVIMSWLNDLTRQNIGENPNMDNIEGIVAESGETRWTLETADKLGISLPAIKASFEVRIASQNGETNFATKLLAAMRNKFGGHDINGK